MATNVKERVSLLEETLNRFILNTDKALYQLSKEMSDFKDEMSDFKDEMSDFRTEVRADIAESKQMRKEMNKKWGELANKLGTFAEDIAAPNIPRIIKNHFKEDKIIRFSTNLRATHPIDTEKTFEFDAVAETPTSVYLLETKYTVREKYLDKIPVIIQNFKDCFPEHSSKRLISIFASMSIHESTVKRLTKMGIYAMAMGDETMDLLNFESLRAKKK